MGFGAKPRLKKASQTSGRRQPYISIIYQNNYTRVFNNRGTAYRLWDATTTSVNGLWPQQGGSDGHREGDRIMCTGFRIRGRANFLPQFKNCIVKMFYVPYNNVQGKPEDVEDFFHN